MLWAGKSRKTTFILGAGATRGAVPYVLVNRKRIKAPLNRDFFAVVEKYATAQHSHGTLNRYLRLRRTLEDEFPTRGRRPLEMEEAFSLLYVSKDFPEIYSSRTGRRRQPGSRKEVEDFLRLTFEVLGAIEVGAKAENLYTELTRYLESSDTVITLNYDTVLDRALIQAGWSPGKGYCLTGGQRKIIPRSSSMPVSPRLGSLKLLKLHGSLNWMAKGSYKKINDVFEKKTSQVLVGKRTRQNDKSGFIRQIIPPIYGKSFNHSQWQSLWLRAYRAVTNCQVFVVIGCSLVDTDFHLSGMLGHAIQERKRSVKPLEYAILVDKSIVRRKWQKLLKGNAPTKIPFHNFAKFMHALKKMRGTNDQDQ